VKLLFVESELINAVQDQPFSALLACSIAIVSVMRADAATNKGATASPKRARIRGGASTISTNWSATVVAFSRTGQRGNTAAESGTNPYVMKNVSSVAYVNIAL